MTRFPGPFLTGRTWLCGVCLALLFATGATGTEVYEWVDRSGVTRYTLRRDPGPPKPPPAVLTPVDQAQASAARVDGLSAPASQATAIPPRRSGDSALPLPPVIEEAEESLAAVPTPKPGRTLTHAEAERIRELEARIQADRESLKQLISQPSTNPQNLSTDPRVLEIGQRLPGLQAELAELREAGP